jgi:adenylate kinase family enzyme
LTRDQHAECCMPVSESVSGFPRGSPATGSAPGRRARENDGVRRCRLHVTGASGSGTTTLGRALATHWSVPHADADDYFWVPTDPPYVEKRPESDRLSLMRSVFVPREAWVLSGSMVGWGEAVIHECEAIVFLTLDPEERLRRLEEREVHRRAGRSFDPDAWEAFLDWARSYDDPAFEGRSRVAHEKWLADRAQPVLRLDSAANSEDLLEAVLDWVPDR